MPVFTVHAPAGIDSSISATDRFKFVRDGFHVWAALFGPFWLLRHRLWLALIGWIIAVAVVDIGLSALGARGGAIFAVNVLIALLMGLEAASLQRWTLSRRKWHQLDVVVGDDQDSAERRFFDRWTAERRAFGYDRSGVERGGPPPTRHVPGQSFSKPPPLPGSDIIGLFPQPGAPR